MKKSVLTMMTLAVATTMAVGALLINATDVAAANLTCTTTQTGGTFNDVTVPAGQACTLDGVRVTGNVTVQPSASLRVTNVTGDTTIEGDIKANDCHRVRIENGEEPTSPYKIVIGGNVSITGCDDGAGARGAPNGIPPSVLIGGNVTCNDNTDEGCGFSNVAIGGNLTCSGNTPSCTVTSNAIAGNATINNNSPLPIHVIDNAIGGNLACKGNSGASGGSSPNNNTVAGAKSGQCAAL